MEMHPVFLPNDGGFVDRFQHPSASSEHQHQQYGAQEQHHRNLAIFGEARTPHQLQPVREQLPPPRLRMHPGTAERERAAGTTAGIRNIPTHRLVQQQQQQVASQDSNDDDGETSSASEDSALSGSYSSPSRSKTRVPDAKPLEPSIVFDNGVSKRMRLHPDSQSKWSPAIDSYSVPGIFRTSGNTPVRQLPRMAALETFQQPALKHPRQQPQLNQGSHHQSPDRPRPPQYQLQQPPPPLPKFEPSQESCHLPAVGSHGHTSTSTSGMIRAAPMQLPRLSMIRAPVPPVAPPLASIGPAARVPASSLSQSPGVPSAGSSPALSLNPSLAAGTRYSRESYQPRRVSYVEAETRVPFQLPPPHASSSTSNNSGLGGALARPWLSRDEGECLRQVPRIEALKGDEPPLPAMHGARGRWAPIWSTPAQHHSEPYDHHQAVETGFSGGNDVHGHMWRNPECARRDSANRDWVGTVGSYQSRPPPGMEEACQPMRPIQQHVKVLLPQGPGTTSSRTPSPATFRQQAIPVHPLQQQQQTRHLPQVNVNSAPHPSETAETAEWRCAGGNGGSARRRDESAEEEKQILEGYISRLNPKASREVWSHDEEEVLWRAQKEYGNAWNHIASLLPGRSENAVKNHWYTQMRMFIGQRGNHPTNSKPCPPATALERAKPVAGQGGPVPGPVGPVAVQGGREAGVKRRWEDDDSRSEAKRGVIESESDCQATAVDNTHEEKEARAEAVAALGMLFTRPRCVEVNASAPISDSERPCLRREGSLG